MEYDIVVIGGGPGGYVAAIKASREGKKVALIEKDKIGGTCLIRGCIPTKTLISHAQCLHQVMHAEKFGIHAEKVTFDYQKMKERKDTVVQNLWQGVTNLVKSHGVDIYHGQGSFIDSEHIKVIGKESLTLNTKNTIIATGSKPTAIESLPVDRHLVHDSTSILELTKLPKHLAIIGGGYIGCEFASLFSELGVKVTLIEFLPGILWAQGKSISRYMTSVYQQKNVEILTETSVKSIKSSENVELDLGHTKLEADMALVSIGRKPVTEGLRLEKAGVLVNEHGFIQIQDFMQTTTENIYAIGDVTGKSMLAHVASHQGVVAVDHICGHLNKMPYHAIPAVIFTDPEIATCGLNLEEAKEKGYHSAQSHQFPFAALGKAQASGHTEGYAEIISDKGTGQILGGIIIGHNASDMISEIATAITNELTVESLAHTIHPHPTLSEIWMETAHLASGYAIHLPPS